LEKIAKAIGLALKVYLDSNVVMRLVFETDKDVEEIAKTSREGKIDTFVSWLSLVEISRSLSRMADSQEALARINTKIEKDNIHVLFDFDPRLSSGSVGTSAVITGLEFSDHLHLLIASRNNLDYVVTYDRDLLSRLQFDSLKIVDPSEFVQQVLKAGK